MTSQNNLTKPYYTLVVNDEDEENLKKLNKYLESESISNCYILHKKPDNTKHRHYIFQIKCHDSNYHRHFNSKKTTNLLGKLYNPNFSKKITNINQYMKYLKFEKGENDELVESPNNSTRGILINPNKYRRYDILWDNCKIENKPTIEPTTKTNKKENYITQKKQEIKLLEYLIKQYDVRQVFDFVKIYLKITKYKDIIETEENINLLHKIYEDYKLNVNKYQNMIEVLIDSIRIERNADYDYTLEKEGIQKVWQLEKERLIQKGEQIDHTVLKEITQTFEKTYTTNYLQEIPDYELPNDIIKRKKELNNFAKINKAFLEGKLGKVGGIALIGPPSVGKSTLIDNMTSGFIPATISQSVSKESSFRFESLMNNPILKLEEFYCKSTDDVQQLKVITNPKDTATVGRKGRTDGELVQNCKTYIGSNRQIWDTSVGTKEDINALQERILRINLMTRIIFPKDNINKLTILEAHITAFNNALNSNKNYKLTSNDITDIIELKIQEYEEIKLNPYDITWFNNQQLTESNTSRHYAILKKILEIIEIKKTLLTLYDKLEKLPQTSNNPTLNTHKNTLLKICKINFNTEKIQKLAQIKSLDPEPIKNKPDYDSETSDDEND